MTQRVSFKVYLSYLVIFVAFLGLWKFVIFIFDYPTFVLPSPESIARELFVGLANGLFIKHAYVTFLETVLGFTMGGAFGVILGYAFGKFPRVELLFSPYIIALQTVPKVALAPLLVLWFGYGLGSKIVIAGLITFFVLFVNVMVGVRSVETNMVNLMRSIKANAWQFFLLVEVPHSLPMIFAGAKAGITLAIIGAIVGEFMGSKEGLGYLLVWASGQFDMPLIVASVVILTLMGLGLYKIIALLERFFLSWHVSYVRLQVGDIKTI